MHQQQQLFRQQQQMQNQRLFLAQQQQHLQQNHFMMAQKQQSYQQGRKGGTGGPRIAHANGGNNLNTIPTGNNSQNSNSSHHSNVNNVTNQFSNQQMMNFLQQQQAQLRYSQQQMQRVFAFQNFNNKSHSNNGLQSVHSGKIDQRNNAQVKDGMGLGINQNNTGMIGNTISAENGTANNNLNSVPMGDLPKGSNLRNTLVEQKIKVSGNQRMLQQNKHSLEHQELNMPNNQGAQFSYNSRSSRERISYGANNDKEKNAGVIFSSDTSSAHDVNISSMRSEPSMLSNDGKFTSPSPGYSKLAWSSNSLKPNDVQQQQKNLQSKASRPPVTGNAISQQNAGKLSPNTRIQKEVDRANAMATEWLKSVVFGGNAANVHSETNKDSLKSSEFQQHRTQNTSGSGEAIKVPGTFHRRDPKVPATTGRDAGTTGSIHEGAIMLFG